MSPSLHPAPDKTYRETLRETLRETTCKTLRTPQALANAGLIEQVDVAGLTEVAGRYAIGVTPAMAALMDPHDVADPIALQFIPDVRELVRAATENDDPIGDRAHEAAPGIVHRYPDRALIKMLHACPVYCRFCFRREMVGPAGEALTGDDFEAAMAYLAATLSIWEVVITGGDPLMLSARRIAALMARLDQMPHIRIVRWHSRVPMVDPTRVTHALVASITSTTKTVYLAIHANHPREFTADARAALKRLARAGAVLVSQSVLLRGINADAETLAELMRAFAEAGVKPYYLHHPDLAPGTGHFRLGIAEGRALVAGLRGRLSGLLQPHYVLDLPGGHGKVALDGDGVSALPDGRWALTDRHGVVHHYPPVA